MEQSCFIIVAVEGNAFPFQESLEAGNGPVSNVGSLCERGDGQIGKEGALHCGG